jgi:hypothetical protein
VIPAPRWVSVNLGPLDRHRLSCYLLGQALLGDIAECLPLFRRINAGQPNFVLGVCVVQDCDGVAILHMNDLAQKSVGLRLKH